MDGTWSLNALLNYGNGNPRDLHESLMTTSRLGPTAGRGPHYSQQLWCCVAQHVVNVPKCSRITARTLLKTLYGFRQTAARNAVVSEGPNVKNKRVHVRSHDD